MPGIIDEDLKLIEGKRCFCAKNKGIVDFLLLMFHHLCDAIAKVLKGLRAQYCYTSAEERSNLVLERTYLKYHWRKVSVIL